MTLEQKYSLCGEPVTMDGQPARISGAQNKFATVTFLHNGSAGAEVEFSWPAIKSVVSKGGNFKSH